MVSARLLRRRHAARFGTERRMPDRLDRAVVGRPLRRGPATLRRTRDGRGADGPRRARVGTAAPARSPVRPVGAGSRATSRAIHPGVRENGGQYTHAAVWIVMALARLGERRRGGGAVSHAQPRQPHAQRRRRRALQDGAVRAGGRRVRGEPARRARRTGAGTRDRRRGCIGRVSRASSACGAAARPSASIPCIPSSWPNTRSRGACTHTRYEISVSNPEHRCRGVIAATLDGEATDASAIPLIDDGRAHDVRIVLGTTIR